MDLAVSWHLSAVVDPGHYRSYKRRLQLQTSRFGGYLDSLKLAMIKPTISPPDFNSAFPIIRLIQRRRQFG